MTDTGNDVQRAAELKKLAHDFGLNDVPYAVKYGLECFAQGAADARAEEYKALLDKIADEKNWFNDCGEWEWLPNQPNGDDEFGGVLSFVKRELEAIRARQEQGKEKP